MNIENFSVYGLNGFYNYSIPIKDNTLILVGENGTGKSTVLAIFKHTIAKEWKKLFSYNFKMIKISVDGVSLTIHHEKEALSTLSYDELYKVGRGKIDDEWFVRLEHHHNDTPTVFIDEMGEEFIHYDSDYDGIEKYNDDGFFEFVAATESFEKMNNAHLLEKVQYKNYQLNKKKRQYELQRVEIALKDFDSTQIIYLPTYRRIERDLDSILVGSNYERRTLEKIKTSSRVNNNQLDMVEFGMKDVKKVINEELERVSSSFRTGMKELMLAYMQDIFTQKHEDTDYKIDTLRSRQLESILARIDSDTLSADIKKTIKTNILNLGKQENYNDVDKVMGYFISKLVDFYEVQLKNEDNIKKFIKTCNKYLVNKAFYFDAVSYEIKIFDKHQMNKKDKYEIPLESLSSGEKQIVSLFAHLSLSRKKGYFVIIDEPELSLSVMWQYDFLEDIKKIGDCKGLFAVTHSPFIYENSLDKYARSIGEFVEIHE